MHWVSLLFVSSLAPASPSAQIDQFVEQQMAAQHIPGLVLRVERDGKVIHRKAYGLANVENKKPADLKMRWDVGSIGKSFTAATVLQLAEKGKLGLEDPAGKFVKDLPDSWRKITIRQLLSHTTGLPDYALVPGVGLADTYTIDTWKKTMFGQKFDFETGRMHQYSNTNFTVLGLVIEGVTGKPYTKWLADSVWRRAGMKATCFEEPGAPLRNVASGYFWQAGKHEVAPDLTPLPMPSDGGSWSTVDDLAAFLNHLEKGKIVSRQSFELMCTGAPLPGGRTAPYGLGWFISPAPNGTYCGHGGNSVGYSAGAFWYPQSKLKVTMLCNLYPIGGQNFCTQIATLLDPSMLPRKLADGTDPNPSRTATLASALADLAAGKADSSLFDPEMRARLATGRGQMVMGAYRGFTVDGSMTFIDERKVGPDQMVRYRAQQKGGASWVLEFAWTKEGSVYSIGRSPDPGKP